MEKEINIEELYKKKLVDMTKEELAMVKQIIDEKIATIQFEKQNDQVIAMLNSRPRRK